MEPWFPSLGTGALLVSFSHTPSCSLNLAFYATHLQEDRSCFPSFTFSPLIRAFKSLPMNISSPVGMLESSGAREAVKPTSPSELTMTLGHGVKQGLIHIQLSFWGVEGSWLQLSLWGAQQPWCVTSMQVLVLTACCRHPQCHSQQQQLCRDSCCT